MTIMTTTKRLSGRNRHAPASTVTLPTADTTVIVIRFVKESSSPDMLHPLITWLKIPALVRERQSSAIASLEGLVGARVWITIDSTCGLIRWRVRSSIHVSEWTPPRRDTLDQPVAHQAALPYWSVIECSIISGINPFRKAETIKATPRAFPGGRRFAAQSASRVAPKEASAHTRGFLIASL